MDASGALQKTLTLQDLIFFGIASIIGSGGFNLIGEAIMKGGNQWPLALGISSAILMGSARTYEEAFNEFKTNTAESDFVKKIFGKNASIATSAAIMLWNILSIGTILVICSHMLFPEGTWLGQITFALILLGLMGYFSLKGMDMNKETINTFSAVLILLLTGVSFLGIVGVGKNGIPSIPNITGSSLPASILFFYFILAGFDALIKFTEETKDANDIPRSFYLSNLIAVTVVFGMCLAFVSTVDMRNSKNYDNGIGAILQKFLGGNTRIIVMYFSIIYMIVTTFVAFLATTRYLFSLGGEYKVLESMKVLNEAKVPTNAVFLTLIASALCILVNHIEYLVRAADLGLSVMLLFVAAAATKSVANKGNMPWVEGSTAVGLAGLAGLTFIR